MTRAKTVPYALTQRYYPSPPFTLPVIRAHEPNLFPMSDWGLGDMPEHKVLQAEQIEDMQRQIGDNVWGFNVYEICRMLSPRTVKPGVSRPVSREHFDFLVDKPFFDEAVIHAADLLEASDSRVQWPPKFYDPFVKFLNEVLKACNSALDHLAVTSENEDIPPFSKRWYGKLQFRKRHHVYEGVDGAERMEPDIHGLIEVDDTDVEKAVWAAADGTMKNKLLLPAAVKNDLKELFGQSATYARCLFDAEPCRRFALIVALDLKRSHLYFLIFHRSGLTCNRKESVDIATVNGRLLAVRLFMTLLLWENAQHAGLDMSISRNQIALPSPFPSVATLAETKYRYLCVRGRATGVIDVTFSREEAPAAMEGFPTRQQNREPKVEPVPAVLGPHEWKPMLGEQHDYRNQNGNVPLSKAILKECWPLDHRLDVEYVLFSRLQGLAGVAQFCAYWEVTDSTGEVVSTRIFLPSPAEAKDAFWDLFYAPSFDHAYNPEYRTMVRQMQVLLGDSLVEARSSAELLDHIQWAAIGWMTIYASGYLHRDISIGNILRINSPAPSHKPIMDYLKESTEQQINRLTTNQADIPAQSTDDSESELQAHSSSDQTAEQVGSLISLDRLRKHRKRLLRLLSELELDKCSAFVTDGDMAIQFDTYFSQPEHQNELSGTLEFMSDGLRNAIEYSKPYLRSSVDDLESIYWVTLWAMVFNVHQQDRHNEWQQQLLKGDRAYVSGKATARYLNPKTHSPLAVQFSPVLRSWLEKLDFLQEDWSRLIADSETIPLQTEKFWPLHFHEFAYRGVCDILDVVKKHRSDLATFPSFAQPPTASQSLSMVTKRGSENDDQADQPRSGKKRRLSV